MTVEQGHGYRLILAGTKLIRSYRSLFGNSLCRKLDILDRGRLCVCRLSEISIIICIGLLQALER